MSPQTRRAHARPRRHSRRQVRFPEDIDTSKALRNYRSQRRRAIVTVLVLTAILVGLPVVLDLWPRLDRLRLVDIPLSWLALAVLPYPLLVVVGVCGICAGPRRSNRRARTAGDRPARCRAGDGGDPVHRPARRRGDAHDLGLPGRVAACDATAEFGRPVG
ncbi:hypothetical protein ACFYXQ_03270 [Nocardia jiangxiensis]|uniref:Uncharacterized protein n=1 Tax=Nocardia jiangxiensis TaxID=282685 RepID=A0ABW6RRZ4_9NOCA